jgi:hypothetical protein
MNSIISATHSAVRTCIIVSASPNIISMYFTLGLLPSGAFATRKNSTLSGRKPDQIQDQLRRSCVSGWLRAAAPAGTDPLPLSAR